MSKQTDLFGDEPPGDAVVSLKIKGQALSPEQQRFNKLLNRTEKLSGQIEELKHLADEHRRVRSKKLHPLEQRYLGLVRDMVIFLHQRLQRKGLSRQQQAWARDIVCGLAGDLALNGDAEMREIFEAHSGESLADREKAEAADAQAFFEDMMGMSFGDGEDMESPEDVVSAAFRKLQEEMARDEAKRAERKAKRRPNARQRQALQQEQDAGAALRTIYRQLASALHPDRESDPAERERKNALMGEANGAYERRDLTALLKLQMRVEQIAPDAVARMAKEKLAALMHLLKEQIKALENDLQAVQIRVRGEFGLPPYGHLTPATLKMDLNVKEHQVRSDIAAVEKDLLRVKDDAELKRWLKEQDRLSRAPNPHFDLPDIF